MGEFLLAALLVVNQILTAGNAITAFSLLLYALTFHLRVRVARAFALVLACVTVTYFGDVLAGTASQPAEQALWLRFQWIGIAYLPAAFLHLSDALLEATGRPSRGRRRKVVWLTYLLGAGFLAAAGLTDWVAGNLVVTDSAAYLAPGPLFPLFVLMSLVAFGFAWVNLGRAYRRALTRSSRRRILYLVVGAAGPVLGTFPFLMVGRGLMTALPLLFWAGLVLVNAMVAGLLVLMAYTVAYFGVSYPDRVVKSRLFQWILRGPVVASTVLAVTVVVGRFGQFLGLENTRAVPFAMVATLLLLQYLITLIRPTVERWLFYGEDRNDIARLHVLEERLLTSGDLRQYLESILNAVCDITGAGSAFAAVVGPEGLELEVAVGPEDPLRGGEDLPTLVVSEDRLEIPDLGTVFRWGDYWLLPLQAGEQAELVGLLGLRATEVEPERLEAEAPVLRALADRVAVALMDRRLQREVFSVVDRLVPEVEEIQRIRAAARYGGAEAVTAALGGIHTEADLTQWVKEALGHYWGGPRLSQSPLLGLRVVRQAMQEHDGNPIKALRAILRQAIEQVKPEGERRFTAEWMLYNILEMKFLEGRKVRDIAMRLAMSEADLYRKQRVAIEMVAKAIAEMEREAQAREEVRERQPEHEA